ncbi:MAG TPA: hypothetical protein VGM04_01560 [Sphingomicrobium sp.]|jgi:hypothetical protein
MISILELEAKYFGDGLGPEDREPLLQHIRAEGDPIKLAGLLQMWGYWFGEEPELKALCLHHIQRSIPYLTATCLKLLCDHWGDGHDYEDQLARYLDPSIYDDWYDEVIVAYSYVSRHPYGWSKNTLARFARVEREAKRLELPSFY